MFPKLNSLEGVAKATVFIENLNNLPGGTILVKICTLFRSRPHEVLGVIQQQLLSWQPFCLTLPFSKMCQRF